MGIPISVLGKLGLPSVESLSTDKVFDKYFSKNIKNYEEFHTAFIDFCSEISSAMPGKHYIVDATKVQLENFFEDTWPKAEREKVTKPDATEVEKKEDEKKQKRRKDALLDFMKKHVKEYKPNAVAMMWTGAVAPGAAVLLKKSGEKVPQLKKLRVDLVPNVVFVPTVTLLSIIGVRVMTVSRATSRT